MFQALLQNAALLITLSFFYGAFKRYLSQNTLLYSIINGVWFGFIALAAMLIPYEYGPGIIYDGRSIVITLAGLWGGGLTVLISVIIAGVYRIIIGGAGMWAGLATIVFCGLTGLIFRQLFVAKLKNLHTLWLLLIGLVTHVVMLGSQLLLPQNPLTTIQNIWIPVFLILPVAFAIIAKLFQFIDRYLQSDELIRNAEEMYRTTLLSIGDAVICTDTLGNITQINPEAERLTGWKANEATGKKLEGVFHIVNERTRETVESPFEKVMNMGTVVGLANHTLLLAKDGREFPIADSGAPIFINGKIRGVVLVFRDQTEEREQMQLLADSETRYREREFWLSESQRIGQIGSYSFDITNDQWTSSPALDAIFGIDTDHPRSSESWGSIIHPDYREEMMNYLLHHVIREKQPFNKEYKIIRENDGEERWVHGHGELRFDDAGNPNQMIGTIQDVTERKVAEEELRNSEERFRKAILKAPIPVMVLDQDGNVLHVSEGLTQSSGYHLNEIPTITAWTKKVYPKEQAAIVEEYINKVLREDRALYTGEYEIIAKSGEKRIWNFYTTPLGKSAGKQLVLTMAPDVTERLRIKKELEISERAYRQLFEDHIAAKVLISPENGEIIRANNAAAKFYGYSVEELQGMNMSDFNMESNEFFREKLKNAKSKKRLHLEFKQRLRTGEIRDVEVFTNAVDYKGQMVMHSIIHDITEKKQLMHDLVTAKEKAEESERLKSAFLANVSHEIRTPLNGIVGFSNILSQNEEIPADKKQEYANLINKSSEGLLKIINDILDLSRLETGKSSLEEQPIDVPQMLSNLHSIFQNQLQAHEKTNVKLNLQLEDSSLVLNGDELRLTQVLSNLLDNAVRFTHRGTIEFGVSNRTPSGVTFFVSDTGIGIPAEKQEAIFGRFVQAETGLGRTYGGTGLGLSIVKKLLELMGSEIHLESAPEKGTRFWFTLPVKDTEDSSFANEMASSDIRDIRSATTQKTKILVVDDDEVSCLFFKQVLQNDYPHIACVYNGKEAIEHLEKQMPDIILLDIGLPDINGLELARRIRKTNQQVKIIVQTAYAMSEEENKAREVGCDDFLTKPIKTTELLDKIQKVQQNYI